MTIDEMNRRKQELGYSYRQIAELAGLPISTVQKTLGKITKSPRYETLCKLEKVLRKKESEAKDELKLNRTLLSYCTDEKTDGIVSEESADYNAKYMMQKAPGDYTYEDYLQTPDDVRMELIDGCFYEMSAPSHAHQLTTGEIYRQLANYVRANKGSCMPVISPADVLLEDDRKTVVQPDVYVTCKKERFKHAYLEGAPDLAIEVLSPSSRSHDMYRKLQKYEQAGVREYWIVDLKYKKVIVYNLEEKSVPIVYPFESEIPVGIWQGKCKVDFNEVKSLLEEWS